MSTFVLINEVGPRDGLQNQKVQVSTADKRALIAALADAGVRAIEACSFVSPKAVPQMADADALYPQLPHTDRIQYSALVPNLRGLERATAAGVREIAVVLASTETKNLRNIRMSLAQTVTACRDTISAARTAGLRTKAYIATAFECPYEGLVSSGQVLALCEDMAAVDVDEIVIADTIGAACPAQVKPLMTTCVQRYGAARISAHFHDTRGFALANVWASLEAGVRKFDASIGGLGGCPFAPGAAGNVATEDVVLLVEQCGYTTGIDVQGLGVALGRAQTMLGQSLGGRTRGWRPLHA